MRSSSPYFLSLGHLKKLLFHPIAALYEKI
jgi:hypothetical protein